MSIESRSTPKREDAIAPEELSSLEDRFLSPDGYRAHPFANDPEYGNYIFELESGEKKFQFFGSRHPHDPEDSEFNAIKNHFQKFNPDLVLIEGTESLNRHPEIREAVLSMTQNQIRHGEPIFTLRLAVEAGVDAESPEPQAQEEIIHLKEQGFSDSDIWSYYLYRSIPAYISESNASGSKDLKTYSSEALRKWQAAFGWDSETSSRILDEALKHINLSDASRYEHEVNPYAGSDRTVQNDVALALSQFRDKRAFERIAANLENYQRIFMVYGGSHGVVMEPALRALFERLSHPQE